MDNPKNISNLALPRLFYSRKEAAYLLSISVRSLDYLIAEGRLHTRKIGAKILVPHDELLRFARHDRSEDIRPKLRTAA